ncbi:MAG TPA: hypothetical protein VK600_00370 [Candidatus Saccharimonadales bacterium]|nr:hypothetical protein [Candidatus Saccharimonadales bacterium]
MSTEAWARYRAAAVRGDASTAARLREELGLAKASLASQAVSTRGLSELARQLGSGSQSTTDMGPGIPMSPAHPDEPEPRRWDYQPGFNITVTPRSYEPISFAMLRALCDNYDVARLCIEKRKSEFRGLGWHIQPKAVAGMSRPEAKARATSLESQIQDVTGFFETPNSEDDFGAWLTQWLDDIISIDAGTLFKRPRRDGGLYGLDVIDGATIRPIIDAYGRQPIPPEPAFGQVIKGITWQMYTADQMVYAPYWQRTRSPYGFPPVMWVVLAVNRALRRQTLDLSKFSEGTMPVGFYKVPENWTTGQIQELQKVFDEILSGNDIERARIRFVPGGANTGLEPWQAEPKSEVEDWLLHITCAAFGVNAMTDLGIMPQHSGGLGGKGVADTQVSASYRNDTAPMAMHIKGILDRVIADDLNQPELEFLLDGLEEEEDTVQKATSDDLYVRMGKISVDELRERDDEDPIGLGAYVSTAQGPVLVSTLLAEAAAPPPEPGGPEPATPSAAPDELTNQQPNPNPGQPIAKVSIDEDLDRWQRKSLKALRLGKNAGVAFESEAISPARAQRVRIALTGATEPERVRDIFRLEKAGASAGPFGALAADARLRLDFAGSSRPSSLSRGAMWYAGWASRSAELMPDLAKIAAAMPAPQVTVNVPKQPPAVIHVDVPPAPAPIVNVAAPEGPPTPVAITVEMAQPGPRTRTVELVEPGRTRRVTVREE